MNTKHGWLNGWRCLASGFVFLGIILSARAESEAAQQYFVLVDNFLQLPAICYPLEKGWIGKGWITWNPGAGNNQFSRSVIFSDPEHHMLVQETAPSISRSEILDANRLAVFQNPNLMAQVQAQVINQGIVEPGLSHFVAVSGRFTQNLSESERKLVQLTRQFVRRAQVNAFRFEGTFRCTYGGVQCKAMYVTTVVLTTYGAVRPGMPILGSSIQMTPRLIIAPPDRFDEARKTGGQMLLGSFTNLRWKLQADRNMLAIVQGQQLGREEGIKIWQESQRRTEETMERIRKLRSEEIREVKTVDNPFSPGEKIERPAFFDKAWITRSQDTMLLSDKSLEPNTIRGLMELGEWAEIE